MPEDIKILLTKDEIGDKVKELGELISKDYRGKNLLLVCILKGSAVFLADLMRAIDLPCSIDFMCVSSYGDGKSSGGVVRIIKDLDVMAEKYDILIVEDILDSGTTLSYIKKMLLQRNPKSLKICAMLDKPSKRRAEVTLDYKGFEIPDEFVVGYGLDYAEKYRNLPFVGILKSQNV